MIEIKITVKQEESDKEGYQVRLNVKTEARSSPEGATAAECQYTEKLQIELAKLVNSVQMGKEQYSEEPVPLTIVRKIRQ